MSPILSFIFSAVAYVIFFVTFCYSSGFVGNVVVPKGIDQGVPGVGFGAVIVNVLLLSVFAVQHSIMARPAFKEWWTTIIPHQIERSTFVLLGSLALLLIYWQWRPFLKHFPQ